MLISIPTPLFVHRFLGASSLNEAVLSHLLARPDQQSTKPLKEVLARHQDIASLSSGLGLMHKIVAWIEPYSVASLLAAINASLPAWKKINN
jgi:hypothetical protein